MTNIYLDENLSEYIADALNSLNKGHFPDVKVLSTKTKFGLGETDENIIPAIGREKGILITKDVNIHRQKNQYRLCEKYKLGVFFLKPVKGAAAHWDLVKMLVNNWQEIIVAVQTERLPFGYEIAAKSKMRKLS